MKFDAFLLYANLNEKLKNFPEQIFSLKKKNGEILNQNTKNI